MEQLRVAPLRTWELIVGKTLPYLAISLMAAVTILVAARLLFDVEVQGPYLALFVATLVYLFGALAFGLLLSTIADSQAMAFQVSLIASMLPALLLSGFLFQIRSMPAGPAGDHLSGACSLLPRHPARRDPQGREPGPVLAPSCWPCWPSRWS